MEQQRQSVERQRQRVEQRHSRHEHTQHPDRDGRQPRLVHALFERLPGHRGRRRVLACLECGLERLTGPDPGECPACGYLGWRDAADAVASDGPPALAARSAR